MTRLEFTNLLKDFETLKQETGRELKNVLFIENGFIVDKTFLKEKNDFNIIEYPNSENRDKKDIIFDLSGLTLIENIDIVCCCEKYKEIAEKLEKISLGRRGLLRKKIYIVYNENL